MKTLEERLAQGEARLERIERLLPAMPATQAAAPATAEIPAAAAREMPPAYTPPAPTRRVMDPQYNAPAPMPSERSEIPVTQILGWAGATAPVRAVAHLIRLALDAGWLTPERRLGLAVLSGLGLIGAGLKLHQRGLARIKADDPSDEACHPSEITLDQSAREVCLLAA
ncbi:DUF2339 domain-containing protein [Thiobacillus sedimenti]|uniref:DUF2339 domain-containing protein n=1 Tax=Thiobacillus sedimenti TaxID=3110231 RepID=A0ABZ1CGX3_9PROT|nr:DUF2339 domain-containing protein [Thiobacillus sp. SCUT-2]WRS38497.1 DUF2339 domain-containing protein [Thiobacillus sp. SCUT-2]